MKRNHSSLFSVKFSVLSLQDNETDIGKAQGALLLYVYFFQVGNVSKPCKCSSSILFRYEHLLTIFALFDSVLYVRGLSFF